MMKIQTLLLTGLCFFANFAQAENGHPHLKGYEAFRFWDQGDMPKIIANYPKDKYFPPEEATVLSNVNDAAGSYGENVSNRESIVAIPSTYSEKGAFRVYLWPQGELKGLIKGTAITTAPKFSEYKTIYRAPLIVLISGLFSTMSRQEPFLTKRIKFFHDQGYHVLVLPTLGGANTIQDHTKVLPFHFRQEANLEIELLKNTIAKLGEDSVESVHLLGLSYGSIIVAVMAGVDAESHHPVIQSATSLSPIFDTTLTLQLLDDSIKKSKEVSKAKGCDDYKDNAGGYISMLGSSKKKTEAKIAPIVADCAEALVAITGYEGQLHGYLDALNKEAFFYRDYVRLNFMTNEKAFLASIADTSYYKYSHDIDLALYAEHGPAVDQLIGEQYYAYWVGLAHRNGQDNIRAITTEDEILNNRNPRPDWTGNEYFQFTEGKNLIILPWGGHGGYTYIADWFPELLNAAFPKYDPKREEYVQPKMVEDVKPDAYSY